MKLLGDLGHVESRFSPFGDSVSVGERCTVCAERTQGSEIVLDAHGGTTRWHVSCRILVHSVCIEHTIGLEIILDAPAVLLGDKAQVEIRFGPFWDSANLYTQ
jgi:hypothetical protein